jgi:hypothetical protein
MRAYAAALYRRYTDWRLLDGELELAMTVEDSRPAHKYAVRYNRRGSGGGTHRSKALTLQTLNAYWSSQ